ncbi:biliverdin-producing heme oxygenase [Flavobacterium sp. 3HN19-14]|uniref:biliverdin-producing heme oxygenase n=1 Tax=Flavobacterium sp. 3HN19-14 TaxID=3448133 RepID=UPI003EE01461
MNDHNTVSFLEDLRAETADAHKKLESLPVSMAITSPTVTKSEYGLYLNLMHDIIRDTESNVFELLGDVIPDIGSRRKLQWLENDLSVVGISAENKLTSLQNNFTIPFALGIMYVVEGSSLGGRFILKNINAVLDYDEKTGAQYFSGYGNTTGSHWKNFINFMTQYEEKNQNADEIIEGAIFAFNAIYNHFSQNA